MYESDFNENTNNFRTLPMLALRGLSVFPHMLLNFDVERPKSVAALNYASETKRIIFLLTQKDIAKESPMENDLYRVGTICNVKQLLRLPGGNIKVLVEGVCRARLVELKTDKKFFVADVEVIDEPRCPSSPKSEAMCRKAVELFDEYALRTSNVTKETVLAVYSHNEPGYIADFIAQNTYMPSEKKQNVLEAINPLKRIELMCTYLARELSIIEISAD
ncbi:MAG: LON peptidase substrate-binding domain-containing protein, partial [Oscillospiraceae bacterium]|nr:LON peptidase substrate-binding domain-containing protein [Oscillospiraceae bacterium]